MAPLNQLSPSYRSGSDYAVEVAGVRFEFAAEDFAERVLQAAIRLGVVTRAALGPADAEDLVALAAGGRIARPGSPLAAHLAAHEDAFLAGDEDVVHWIRRLVFRGAWLDRQVADGLIEPRFEDGRGFAYRSAHTGVPAGLDPAMPDWSHVAYRDGA